MKILLLGILMVILSAFTVSAQSTSNSSLAIHDITLWVNGDKESGIDEDGGDVDKVKPGDIIKIKVEVENNFPSGSDIDLEDIELDAVIQDMDDGDDLDPEEDADDINDISPTKDENFDSIEFIVPLLVGDGTFDLEIIVTADTANNTIQKATATIEVEVEKDTHEVIITKSSLSRSTIKCKGSTTIDLTVVNIGEKDEDVEIEITNDDLTINEKDTFLLEEGDFDSDQKNTVTRSLKVQEGASAGSYEINVDVYFDDRAKKASTTLDLEVEACTVVAAPAPAPTTTPDPVTTTVVQSTSSTPAVTTPSTTTISSAVTSSTEPFASNVIAAIPKPNTGFDSTSLLVIVIEVLAIVIGLALLIKIVKK